MIERESAPVRSKSDNAWRLIVVGACQLVYSLPILYSYLPIRELVFACCRQPAPIVPIVLA